MNVNLLCRAVGDTVVLQLARNRWAPGPSFAFRTGVRQVLAWRLKFPSAVQTRVPPVLGLWFYVYKFGWLGASTWAWKPS
jgi:hypothetical protein